MWHSQEQTRFRDKISGHSQQNQKKNRMKFPFKTEQKLVNFPTTIKQKHHLQVEQKTHSHFHQEQKRNNMNCDILIKNRLETLNIPLRIEQKQLTRNAH